MSRTKESIIQEALDFIEQGNSLKLALAGLRRDVDKTRDVIDPLLRIMTPCGLGVVKKIFGDDLKIELTIGKELKDMAALEMQIAKLYGQEISDCGDSIVALSASIAELKEWSRPRLDMLAALSKGRIKVYQRLCTHFAIADRVYKRLERFLMEALI